jgi:hypothetical protein
MSAYGTKRTSACRPAMSAFGGKADIMGGNPMSAFDPNRTLVIAIPAEIFALQHYLKDSKMSTVDCGYSKTK